MGSERFLTHQTSDLLVTVASFPATAVLEAHTHDRPVFAVMLDGGFDLAFTSPAIRRATLPCTAGTILTEPAGEKHANFISPTGAHVVVVQPDLGRSELPSRCVAMLERINHFRDAPIVATARRLAREVEWPDDLTPLAAEGMALEMFAEAARLEEDRGFNGRRAPGWLQEAVAFLHDRYRESVRIDHVAEVAGVHPAHLAAVFRRVHRMPIASYMRRLRIEWAADRLVRSNEPISVIAAAAGFADQAHLTRWFKRATGSTPAVYRRSRRRVMVRVAVRGSINGLGPS